MVGPTLTLERVNLRKQKKYVRFQPNALSQVNSSKYTSTSINNCDLEQLTQMMSRLTITNTQSSFLAKNNKVIVKLIKAKKNRYENRKRLPYKMYNLREVSERKKTPVQSVGEEKKAHFDKVARNVGYRR